MVHNYVIMPVWNCVISPDRKLENCRKLGMIDSNHHVEVSDLTISYSWGQDQRMRVFGPKDESQDEIVT